MATTIEETNGRKLDELENYFHSYRDMPREVVLKHDLLRDGHWFTDAALELASEALVKSYRLFSYDLMPMKDMKRKEHRKITEWFTMRGGPYGLRPVTVQTTLNSASPYIIDAVDGKAKLLLQRRRNLRRVVPAAAEILHAQVRRRHCLSRDHRLSATLSQCFAIASTGGRTRNAASATSTSTRAR